MAENGKPRKAGEGIENLHKFKKTHKQNKYRRRIKGARSRKKHPILDRRFRRKRKKGKQKEKKENQTDFFHWLNALSHILN